jgi:hypothetical protein
MWPDKDDITDGPRDTLLINAHLSMVRETRRIRNFIVKHLGQEQADLTIPKNFPASIYSFQV